MNLFLTASDVLDIIATVRYFRRQRLVKYKKKFVMVNVLGTKRKFP